MLFFTNIGTLWVWIHVYHFVLCSSSSFLFLINLPPFLFQIMLELGFSHRGAFMASLFTVFGESLTIICLHTLMIKSHDHHWPLLPPDNSLVIQSRVIMLDAFLIFFTYLSVLCFLKFYHKRLRLVNFAQCSYCMAGCSNGCSKPVCLHAPYLPHLPSYLPAPLYLTPFLPPTLSYPPAPCT